ncbi:PIG-L deacetylase family protein [Thermoactinomyces mirandus]|uniref:PIG-L family deacetylase n=1 Tax=Thermoactinomyces mirandus TaxID=2756294 RepID=A0A7W2ASR4_9BACL|nr:PIG-L family deacetylase [Thermoactinomyces mirandus]MBA4602930.1 PIG-L family deacetylase [Thermoactinomyces mirandus]
MKLRTIIIAVSITVIFLLAFSVFQEVSALEDKNLHALNERPANLSDQPTIVFVAPHADDELLSMGVDIVNHLRLRWDVHLVLMSPGGHSRARFLLNGFKDSGKQPYLHKEPVYCPLHKRYHDPEKEKYSDPYLDVNDLGNARVREFREVARRLGVPEENVHIYNIENDRFDEQYEEISDVIEELLKRFPDAHFRTTSIWDFHPDHAMLGKVLMEYEQKNRISPDNTLYFISIYKARFTRYHLPFKEYTMHLIDPQDAQKIKYAAQVYGIWDPANEWYQIGYHSVKSQFEKLVKNVKNKYHY